MFILGKEKKNLLYLFLRYLLSLLLDQKNVRKEKKHKKSGTYLLLHPPVAIFQNGICPFFCENDKQTEPNRFLAKKIVTQKNPILEVLFHILDKSFFGNVHNFCMSCTLEC